MISLSYLIGLMNWLRTEEQGGKEAKSREKEKKKKKKKERKKDNQYKLNKAMASPFA